MKFGQKIKSIFYGNTKTSINDTFVSINDIQRFGFGYGYSKYYNNVPELRSIIDQQADMFTKIKLSITRNEKPETNLTDKLNSPNYLQSFQEFKAMFYKQFSLYSVAFIYFRAPYGFSNITYDNIRNYQMFVLPFDKLYIELNQKNALVATDIKELINRITYNDNGSIYEIDLDNLLIINESAIDFKSALLGKSRLDAVRNSLDNLLLVSESVNFYSKHRGASGIFSPENPRIDTQIFDDVAKENVENELKKYGTLANQRQYIVSPSSIKFQKIVLSPKELDFNTTIVREKINLSDVLGHSILLLNEMAGSTFSNYETARKIVYENRVIPIFEMFVNALKSFINVPDNVVLEADYSRIEALQADKKVKSELDKTNTETIISINKEVAAGNITHEIGVLMLVSIGYSESNAKELIIKTKNDAKTDN